jgi:hypothetical protein
MCAPVLGAGRNGPYMEDEQGERQSRMDGMGFLCGNFDCPVELPPCSPCLDCFHNAEGKYTFLSLLAAMIKMIEEQGNGTMAAGKVTMITKLVKELRIIGRDHPCTMYHVRFYQVAVSAYQAGWATQHCCRSSTMDFKAPWFQPVWRFATMSFTFSFLISHLNLEATLRKKKSKLMSGLLAIYFRKRFIITL